MSMKNANKTIGNQSRDLPVCSAVPQLPHYRVLIVKQRQEKIKLKNEAGN
jgi:hypothetical protein